ncbi:MAG: hypothetical protein RM338_28895 [Nostoc sp. DedQUE12a]|nr:hypothetical protein [Nostoc sp. DedQUE12a]
MMLSLSFDNGATYDTSRLVTLLIKKFVIDKTILVLRKVMKLASVLDSVVSQFTIANLVYKIVGHEASAKGWFATGN